MNEQSIEEKSDMTTKTEHIVTLETDPLRVKRFVEAVQYVRQEARKLEWPQKTQEQALDAICQAYIVSH